MGVGAQNTYTQELENRDEFQVNVEVEDVGQKTISNNWVRVRKDDGVKARLVMRGDLELEKETIRTDSPTVNESDIKFFIIVAHFGWDVRSADIKSTFLQGAEL